MKDVIKEIKGIVQKNNSNQPQGVETNITPEIIAKMNMANQENMAAQLLEVQKSLYLLSSRFKAQAEQLNALTCAIQEMQHDQEEAGLNNQMMEDLQPFDTDPKLQEMFRVSQAWENCFKPKNKKVRLD